MIISKKKGKITWQKDECLLEAKSYNADNKINYMDLARRYNLKNTTG